MKKNLRNTCAKTLAVVLAMGMVASVSPVTADAAAKKPTVTKKVSVNVGKTKTVKVTSKKKVKKTTWSLTKAGKKVVSLSKKKAKSVTVKGKKAGKATLTAKIKVGKKTYKKTCKITVTKAAVVTTKPTAVPTPTATNNSNGGNNNNTNSTPTPTPPVKEDPTPTPTVPAVTANPPVQPEKPTTEPAVLPVLNLREEAATTWSKEGSYGTAIFNTDDTVSFSSQPWAIDTTTNAIKEGNCYNNGISWFIDANTQGQVDLSEYETVEITVKTDAEVKLMTWAGTADATSFWDKNDTWGGTSDVRENPDGSKTLVYTLQKAFGNATKVKKAIAIGLTLKSDKDGDDAAFSAREATIYKIEFVKGSSVDPGTDTPAVDTPAVDTPSVEDPIEETPIKELKTTGYTSLTDLGVTLDTTKTYESVTIKIKAFNANGDVITPEDENYATYGAYPKLTLGTEESVTNEYGTGFGNGAGGNTSDYSKTWAMYFLNNIGKYGVDADENGYINLNISLYNENDSVYLVPGTDYDGIGLQVSSDASSISGIAIYSVTFNEKAN